MRSGLHVPSDAPCLPLSLIRNCYYHESTKRGHRNFETVARFATRKGSSLAGMDVFELHSNLISDYGNYARSFLRIGDDRIKECVEKEIEDGLLWPDPLLQLNPNFEAGATVTSLVESGVLHADCDRIFRIKSNENDLGKPMTLYRHQAEAIEIARQGHPYVLTTGTGSGKSLAYIIPIVDHILRHGTGRGIQAVIVYPMNALANSQMEELAKFVDWGFGGDSPVTYGRYTGQESQSDRERLLNDPPDILLTNYVMLELILTRVHEEQLVRAAADTRFLVFDELHTYRGRQGADVSMLIRRCREAFTADNLLCVGTSATMASGDDLSSAQKRAQVAAVATRMFGQAVGPDHVIGETLHRTTAPIDLDASETAATLHAAAQSLPDEVDYETLRGDPVCSWIESTVGMKRESGTDVLIRQTPRSIGGESGLASELAAQANCTPEDAAAAIRHRLKQASAAEHPETGTPLFAFRLHQFITRGDTAWATLEPEADREITLKGGERFSKDDETKRLYPLCFCRECGQAYYRVDRNPHDASAPLLPRLRFEQTIEDDVESGYVFVSNNAPWPTDDDAINERLPDEWLETHNDRQRVRRDRRNSVPSVVHLAPDGTGTAFGEGLAAAWIPAPFRFCLNPACKVSYNFRQKSDRGKLSTLGVDGRSTATSVLSLAVLMALRSDEGLDDEARKLLSFTDNRQDAALQAGHFNDFVEVSMVRSGLFRALELAGERGIEHATLPQQVFDVLDLPLELYADGELRGPARRNAETAMRMVLEYFLYRDLQRGWRVTSPNLEQCDLLRIEYDGLDELANDTTYWAEKGVHNALTDADADTRREVIRTLLDHLRRSLAIKHEYLTRIGHENLVNESRQRLRDLWRFELLDELERGVIAWPGSRPNDRAPGDNLYVSAQSNFGMYLHRTLGAERLDDRAAIIDDLFRALEPWGLVEEVRNQDGRIGYQVPAYALIWKAGDGTEPMVDPLRVTTASDTDSHANRYFIRFYRRFAEYAALFEAREHTAQVPADIRQQREDRFRHGDLPLMFCSPTMELGIDISQLNVVNMRNVPPTPANYAQRSGRAGRPGRKSQPALIFTYCSGFSPHDQYYFKRQSQMVAGQVTTPRIELGNQDLIRAHIQALWLSQAGLDLGKTLTHILQVSEEDMQLGLKQPVLEKLHDAAIRGRALQRARSLLSDTPEVRDALWWREDWIDDVLLQIPEQFDRACDRWRDLYRSAVSQRLHQNRVIGDHSRSEVDRKTAKRLRAQAESQITLLTDARSVVEGDFSSYRYFASEGFLPGYNFPRLPLSAFIPGRRGGRGQNEFLSRARFLAISEFGPKSIIYHEGSQYEINKVNLTLDEDTGSITKSDIKVCHNCGCGHFCSGNNDPNNCTACGVALDTDDKLIDLVRMQNVSAIRRNRITSDEEERRRIGFEIRSTYEFGTIDGRPDVREATVVDGEQSVATLTYGDTAKIYRVNVGWNRRKTDSPLGFMLDLERGYWAKNRDIPTDEDADNPDIAGRFERVTPYVEDRRNALILKLATPGEANVMASLQAALKEAMLRVYQLESVEMAVEPLPSRDNRKVLFFFESAEGGAGVLRRLVQDPGAIATLAKRAMEICHISPETGEDIDSPSTCTAACYECLLDYGNQRDHELLDRRSIVDILLQLARSEVVPGGQPMQRQELLQRLWDNCDSQLERSWLKTVEDHGFVPPSHGQFLIPACSTKPDFYYADHNTAIYIDGPHHDDPEQQEKDADIDARLTESGKKSIRFHHTADWLEVLQTHTDIFGPGREDA